ncbi:tetraacyldisaccharide 4'-kinase [Vreelandella lutescens]|uniref:Tetraacyldisaccharide 4'-kinase n=1 Tax=Vreelandella lutescens TaxID=1602943 RepID=A0ABQ1NPD2_9GAMM|nr:tetraacyldisaccharide 4'-kinase [Halomonas lutescens]GGC81993.1 tetraacyldisaccharide 4'-kinase [Halomonas lutescens]
MSLAQRWLKAAYGGSAWLAPLYPLGSLYRYLACRREQRYRRGNAPIWQASVPVIVVGNITLGGTGKSPLVAWLSRWLQEQGYSPGIVTRGYGGKAPHYPLLVTPSTDPQHSGDEPLMLAQQTGVPVIADPQRARGAQALVQQGCNIVISDDGLQHLALGRDIELVVIDGARGLGNRRCLPAGPLREAPARLASVDAVIINGALQHPLEVPHMTMQLVPQRWRYLATGQHYPLQPLPFTLPVHGLAGIGNPQRFFNTLQALGVQGDMHPFEDHQPFNERTVQFTPLRPIIMTAKDAVKCQAFAPPDSWVLEVEAQLPQAFEDWLLNRLSVLTQRGRIDG